MKYQISWVCIIMLRPHHHTPIYSHIEKIVWDEQSFYMEITAKFCETKVAWQSHHSSILQHDTLSH